MEIVFNDYSLNSQFLTPETFVDSLSDHTLPLLNLLSNSSLILKKYQSYDLHITSDTTLNEFLNSKQFRGYSESQKLRSLLVNLMDEPYWEESPKTDIDSTYETKYTGTFTGNEPNCFSESYERDKIILSIKHDDFTIEEIAIKKNNISDTINNFYNKQSSLDVLFKNRIITFSEFLIHLSETAQVSFYKSNNKYYVDKELDNEHLTISDMLKIADHYKLWLLGIQTGNMLPRLTDSILHKGISYNEFRVTLDDQREFRMFYKIFGQCYVFFNTLLKDTQTTPKQTKDKTYALIKDYSQIKNKPHP